MAELTASEIEAVQKALNRIEAKMSLSEFCNYGESFDPADVEYLGQSGATVFTDRMAGDFKENQIVRVKGDPRLWYVWGDDEEEAGNVFLLPIWIYLITWEPTENGYCGEYLGEQMIAKIFLDTEGSVDVDSLTIELCRANLFITNPDDEKNPTIGETIRFRSGEDPIIATDPETEEVLLDITKGFFTVVENEEDIKHFDQGFFFGNISIIPLNRIMEGDENTDRIKEWIETYLLETSYNEEKMSAEEFHFFYRS